MNIPHNIQELKTTAVRAVRSLLTGQTRILLQSSPPLRRAHSAPRHSQLWPRTRSKEPCQDVQTALGTAASCTLSCPHLLPAVLFCISALVLLIELHIGRIPRSNFNQQELAHPVCGVFFALFWFFFFLFFPIQLSVTGCLKARVRDQHSKHRAGHVPGGNPSPSYTDQMLLSVQSVPLLMRLGTR